MDIYLLLASVAFLGILNTLYLYYKSHTKKPIACPLKSDCHVVLGSKWNKFLGVKNEIWGLIYYTGFFVYALALKQELAIARTLLIPAFMVDIFAIFYSAYLTGIQIFKLKEYCFYCLCSALFAATIAAIMAMIVFV